MGRDAGASKSNIMSGWNNVKAIIKVSVSREKEAAISWRSGVIARAYKYTARRARLPAGLHA